MDVIAVISAIIGLILLIMTVIVGYRIRNRWLRYMALIVGIMIAVGTAGSLPPVLGANDMATSARAGVYLLYLGIAAVITNELSFRKTPDSQT